VQSFVLSFPGLCFGMAVAALLNICLRFAIYAYADNYMSYNLSAGAIIIGVLIGTLVPMFTNIFPV
jgi:predicted membrane-bound spermidine synthase